MDHNVNILNWNVRGLNQRCRQNALRGFVSDVNAAIVCIQETKLNVNEMLGPSYMSFSYLPATQTRGGVLIACRAPDITLAPRHVGDYSVTVEVTMGDMSWVLTSVYGPQADEDKVLFLDKLRTVHSSFSGPWMIAGDFNLILDAADKSNDSINRRNIGRFRRFVDDMEVKDVHLHGRSYTWSNEREHPTLVKLDRILVSVDTELAFPNCFLQPLSSDFSDHAPLLFSTNAATQHKKRFHFEKF